MKQNLEPADWAPPKGYSNGILVSGPMIFLGGQIGWNGQQVFDALDFLGQARQALKNIVCVLQEAQAGPRASGAAYLVRARCAGVSRQSQGPGGYLSGRNRPALSGHDLRAGQWLCGAAGASGDRGHCGLAQRLATVLPLLFF